MIRDQEFLLPPNMADWLDEDHLVWFVLDVVERLDTTRFHATRRTGGAGRQGYDPDMLLALLVYAYAVGERSSRRIERLCGDHVAFRVLCAQDAPDHTTLARFRAEHHEAFKDLFAQILRLCSVAGMVKVGVVAIDGTKIAANASRGANRAPETVREEARKIAEQIVAEADATDAKEARDDDSNSDGGLPPGFASQSRRAANIKKAMDELDRQDAEHGVADEVDAKRAAVVLRSLEAGVTVPGPPAAGVDPVRFQQARVARERARIAALDGVGGKEASRKRRHAKQALKQAEAALAKAEQAAADGTVDLRGLAKRRRDRRSVKSRARGGTGRVVNVTDPDSRLMTEGSGGGSVQGYNAQLAVTDDHLILGVHVSQDANDTDCYQPTLTQASAHADLLGKTIDLVVADAGYFTDNNLTSPGPARLIAPGKTRDVLNGVHHDASASPPPAGVDPKQSMRHLLKQPDNIERYKRRGATVETVNAHLKEQTKLRRFSRRGIAAVTAELHLAAAVINLRRLHTAQTAT